MREVNYSKDAVELEKQWKHMQIDLPEYAKEMRNCIEQWFWGLLRADMKRSEVVKEMKQVFL